MKQLLSVVVLCIVILAGCQAVETPGPELSTSQDVAEQSTPTLTIDSLDSSIPLGDSFPIVVNLKDAPANQQVEFELVNGDIIPSTSRVATNTDGSGNATIRLTGRSTRPELNALYARVYLEDDQEIVGQLYVNFEPPQPTSLDVQATNLEAQAEGTTVGEPITFDNYVETLPVANSLDDLKTASESSTSGVRLQGVRFPEENGELGEPIDALEFSSGTQIGDVSVIPSGTCALTTTHVYLKTVFDGAVASFPTGTKVFISGSGTTPDKTTYTDDDGKVSFPFGCANALYIRVQGLSNTGLQVVTGSDESGYPLLIWSKAVKAGLNKVLTAEGVAGDTVQLSTTAANSTARTAQEVYSRVEQFRQWELSSHSRYSSSTFPISVVYPDRNPFINSSRAHYGRMFIEGGSSTQTIVHETGHEVYYRRMLGSIEYMSHYRRARSTNITGFPSCAGYFNGWTPWTNQQDCEAMLEGFADWWSRVARSDVFRDVGLSYEYRPSGTPSGASVPGNVATFLWDITDLSAAPTVRDNDGDEVRVSGTAKERYARVAAYFYGADPSVRFTHHWENVIFLSRPSDQRYEYCMVLKRNTILNSNYWPTGCRNEGVGP